MLHLRREYTSVYEVVNAEQSDRSVVSTLPDCTSSRATVYLAINSVSAYFAQKTTSSCARFATDAARRSEAIMS